RRHTRWPRDWSSDVCSSDLIAGGANPFTASSAATTARLNALSALAGLPPLPVAQSGPGVPQTLIGTYGQSIFNAFGFNYPTANRSEEHTSELQSRGHLVCRL